MGLKRGCYNSWIFLLIVLCSLLFSKSSLYGQWTSVTPPTVSVDWLLAGIHFTSADEGWAVGYDSINTKGVLLHYQDGIWTSVTPPEVSGDWDLWGIHFTSADEGWAVGSSIAIHYTGDSLHYMDGILLHYKDGIWTSVAPPDVSGDWQLLGIHFTSADEGWAVGLDSINTKGVLLHYQSGIWTSVTPPTVNENSYLYSIHFTSANEGWAVGYIDNHLTPTFTGFLLHYKDGIWTSVTPPTVSADWDLEQVHFTSANEGWALGYDYTNSKGVLLHYQSGIWTSVAPPDVSGDWQLWGIHFTSANEGWAVGYDYTNTKGVLLQVTATMSPNEGTIGTQVTISGIGFGEKKGKVLISGVATKIAKDGWKPDSITCTVTKVPSVGTHNVTIKPYKADDIILSNAFTVKPPEIDFLDFYHGVVGTPITINGNFFSTKKGKAYLEFEQSGKLKKKNCKVMSWGMGSITFIVPKTSKSFPAGTYPLKVTNKVGTAGAPSDFTID